LTGKHRTVDGALAILMPVAIVAARRDRDGGGLPLLLWNGPL
jgi:hypothetical protein